MTLRQTLGVLLAVSTCASGLMFFDYSGLSTAWHLLSTVIPSHRARAFRYNSVVRDSTLNMQRLRAPFTAEGL